MKLPLRILLPLSIIVSCLPAAAGDLLPRLTQPEKLLLEETFSTGTVPKPWEPGGRPGSFSIVDGALQGICPADDHHGPSIAVPLEGRNFTIAFRFKYSVPGYFLFLLHLPEAGASQTSACPSWSLGTRSQCLSGDDVRDIVSFDPTIEFINSPSAHGALKLGLSSTP
jgi:hypothetical protein